MNEKQNTIDRRNFLKTVGAAGLSSVLVSTGATAGPNQSNAEEKPKYPQVPRRKLGKTGVKIPCLSLGTNRLDNQVVLKNTLQWGVSYWDTANFYVGGNSEISIGKFLSKNPNLRKKLFISTKAMRARTLADVEKSLATSLKKMNIKYIDLYYGRHMLSDPAQLTDELRQWAKSAKERKLIRHFGITTHQNMAKVLAAAAKLDWIDAILTLYNFRLRHDAKMQAAIEACHKAGIGLIAMKTQGLQIKTKEDKKLAEHFLQRGFTEGQAKIKAVLQDKRFSSACVGMNKIGILKENIAAVLDKTKLSQADMAVFKEYAQETCSGYCAGCAYICDSALPDAPYVSNIMRYLMYYNSYGEQAEARRLFAQVPTNVRNKLLSMDYSLAEARCPQRLPIRELVAEAVGKLT